MCTGDSLFNTLAITHSHSHGYEAHITQNEATETTFMHLQTYIPCSDAILLPLGRPQ